MKSSRIIFGLFVAAVLAQLAAPASLLWKYEQTLQTGRAYKFRTAPVDPYDAFRGRFVALAFENTSAPVRKGEDVKLRQRAFVQIEEGADGFARFTELSATPPAHGDYLRVEPTWRNPTNTQFTVSFNRYYLEETKAPKAERAYWESNRRSNTNRNTYALVRVRSGLGVIEDLYIDGKPVSQYLQEAKP